ncbi:DegV family protein [Paenisporosarcina cavernae]|uniref:DegV family protein n=1 Tax=Paenisporosarcina cavernae TaxID=2320858 RepID=A0A385YQG6_9BACL|nr:DegV family protein [Paenisporosarcina cavernae]AYC28999.1 DegV family protein [Paenisporosarcina cavernae]
MRLFADSACDLPKSFYETNNVTLVPLRVHLEDKEYMDVETIDSKEVFEAIRRGVQPKTSQASPEQFFQLFEELAKSGEEGFYLAFSSELSGTHNTAVMIREQLKEDYPELKLTIVDSRAASLGYGMLVKEAVKLRNAGESSVRMEEILREKLAHLESIVIVEDLDYMARGGRISKSSAFVGGLLNIKPIIHMEDGKLVPIEKLRGRKKAMKRVLDIMEERGERLNEQTIGICHGDDLQAANELKELIEETFHPNNIEIEMIGSAVGAHTGPSTLAVFFQNKLS